MYPLIFWVVFLYVVVELLLFQMFGDAALFIAIFLPEFLLFDGLGEEGDMLGHRFENLLELNDSLHDLINLGVDVADRDVVVDGDVGVVDVLMGSVLNPISNRTGASGMIGVGWCFVFNTSRGSTLEMSLCAR